MKQQVEQRSKRMEFLPRTFYRPDSYHSELGAWFFLTPELGEVGPFNTREEAKEALEMSLLLSPDHTQGNKKAVKKKRSLH